MLQQDRQHIQEMLKDCQEKEARLNQHTLRGDTGGPDSLPIDLLQKQDLGCEGLSSLPGAEPSNNGNARPPTS